MKRNMLGEQEFLLSAWRAFLICACLGVAATLAAFLVLGLWEGFLAIVAATVAPFIASSYVSNRPSRMARWESLSYLRHAPSVIGAMAMSMSVSPSLDKAVLFASRSSLDPLGRRLALASWGVLTRSWPDIESALVDLAGSLGGANHALRQSLYLFSASSHEPTKEGMERLMEKAHEISVQGLRDAAEHYVAGLSTPVMAIFALGILLPIMLLSIVPLLAMASPVPDGAVVAGSQSPPMFPISILLLVIIPVSCLLYSRSLVSSSPMADAPEAKMRTIGPKDWPWLIWLLALAGYALVVPVQTQPYLTLALVAMPPALIVLRKGAKRPKKKERAQERDFILGLYQLGNRLSTGASLERAMAEAADACSKGAFAEWCAAVLHKSRMARIPMDEAMGAIDPIPDRPLVQVPWVPDRP